MEVVGYQGHFLCKQIQTNHVSHQCSYTTMWQILKTLTCVIKVEYEDYIIYHKALTILK